MLNLGTSSSTSVVTIADIVTKAMGLEDVEFQYTGGGRGWRGDVPQVRFDMARMGRLGWEPRYTSDEAVRQAARDLLANE